MEREKEREVSVHTWTAIHPSFPNSTKRTLRRNETPLANEGAWEATDFCYKHFTATDLSQATATL